MRIGQLTIYSSNLDRQVAFYGTVLGLPILEESEGGTSFRVGRSTLRIEHQENARSYHLAINIPSNQVNGALSWLKERVAILQDDGDDLVRFDSWNATAMYFYDADHNIIEFIARRDLNINTSGPFHPGHLIAISEIGMPVDDIEATWNAINKIAPLQIYDGSFHKFCAVGDPDGLLIIIDKNQKRWFPTNDIAFSSDFVLQADISFRFFGGVVETF